MDNERTASISIGGDEYVLLLTTKATKEIAGRYGGLENLGDKLMKSENVEMALSEIVWLITLLCNQPILVHPSRPVQQIHRHRLRQIDHPLLAAGGSGLDGVPGPLRIVLQQILRKFDRVGNAYAPRSDGALTPAE